jgi:hypothetical protein
MPPQHRKQRPDLDERVSLHPLDPEEGLRKLLRQPPLDKRKTKSKKKAKPSQ